MEERLLSPEAEAGGGQVVAPEQCASQAIRDCGGIVAAIEWATTWAHRRYFREVLDHLRGWSREVDLEDRWSDMAARGY